MNSKYDTWLTAAKGRPTQLARELGVKPAATALAGRMPGRPLPPAWRPVIVRLAGGELDYADLLPVSSQTAIRAWKAGLLPKNKAKLNLALVALGRQPQRQPEA